MGEIRAMPYPEYRSWELFYLIEPFGFANDEYRMATNLSILYNINKGKGKAKEPKEFMRDMPAMLLSELKEKPSVETMSREELIRQIKKDFGIQ